MPYIDFNELKSRTDIVQVARLFALQPKTSGVQQRGSCPRCNSGGDRALVITPDRGLFYCFPGKVGGDFIKLVAHIKDCSQNEAAKLIAEKIGIPNSSVVKTRSQKVENAEPKTVDTKAGVLQALPYLEPDHPTVQALGISTATAKAFASGYAGRGVLRGRLAVPIHNQEGLLLAYVGLAVTKEQLPQLLFHNFDPVSVIFNAHRLASTGDIVIYRDPLHVLLAVENGISPGQVVSFLTDRVSAEQFDLLAALMHEKNLDPAQLL